VVNKSNIQFKTRQLLSEVVGLEPALVRYITTLQKWINGTLAGQDIFHGGKDCLSPQGGNGSNEGLMKRDEG
jgi:hypothetical protein